MRWIAVAAGVLLVASLVGSEEQAVEETSPLIYTLEVNGQSHSIEPGKLLTLPAQEGPVKVLLKVAPYRVFRTPGVEFQFPRGWELEQLEMRDTKRKIETWSLRMRRFHFYVSMERGERDIANVMEGQIDRRRLFRPKDDCIKVIRNDRPLTLASYEVAGTTIHDVQDYGVVSTHYAVRTGPDTVLFTFWELRMDGLPGEPSTEWKEMELWLQESLKVLPASEDK